MQGRWHHEANTGVLAAMALYLQPSKASGSSAGSILKATRSNCCCSVWP